MAQKTSGFSGLMVMIDVKFLLETTDSASTILSLDHGLELCRRYAIPHAVSRLLLKLKCSRLVAMMPRFAATSERAKLGILPLSVWDGTRALSAGLGIHQIRFPPCLKGLVELYFILSLTALPMSM